MTEAKPAPSRRQVRVRSGLAGLIPLVATVLFVAALAAIGAAMWLYYVSPQTNVASGKPVQVRIEPGVTTRGIGEALTRAGVVANANGFELRSRLAGADVHLKPGVYDLTTGMSYRDVLERLKTGPAADYTTITIPEGFRLEQIAARLGKEAGIPTSEFLALAQHGAPHFAERHPILLEAYRGSLEGYLFPKTYAIRRGTSAEQAIEMMLEQFDRETAGIDFTEAQQRGVTPRQVVIIASMIERESKLDRERPLVSAVIEYVLRDNRFRLTNRDLYTPTPYNTYLHTGLPPGPISNPGTKSLFAAAHPAHNSFLYYVLTGKDGSHTFTTDLAGFLVAKRRSKEVFGR